MAGGCHDMRSCIKGHSIGKTESHCCITLVLAASFFVFFLSNMKCFKSLTDFLKSFVFCSFPFFFKVSKEYVSGKDSTHITCLEMTWFICKLIKYLLNPKGPNWVFQFGHRINRVFKLEENLVPRYSDLCL